MTRTLATGFLASMQIGGERPAISIEGVETSYRALGEQAMQIAATLDHELGSAGLAEPEKLTAVLGHRHVTAFAGILGALFRGHGYVPLNPMFPSDRTAAMLERSETAAMVVDPTAHSKLVEVAGRVSRPLLLLLPDADSGTVRNFAEALPSHRVLGRDALRAPLTQSQEPSPDDIAYLLFTSGSTGIPKGVMVAHRNVVAFLDAMIERYRPVPEDRFSQTFDLTFDLSVFDMFLAWWSGACLCVPTAAQKAFPGKYASSAGITIWFSVPSTAVLMSKLRMLKEGAFPRMRYALFCGEALPVEVVQKFAQAAPNATVENLYGPTELTIACTLYRWRPGLSEAESELGVVPIGEPYPGMEVRIVDESLHDVKEGEAGELVMTGPQLSLGYFRDPAKTEAAFIKLPGEDRIFYRTGDRVRRVPSGALVYLGRVDNQIKIQGYRVELGEIESVLREVAASDVAIAVGWPRNASGADGIVGFVARSPSEPESIKEAAAARLPSYMQPRQIRYVDNWPLNANGKVDRKALLQLLEIEASTQ